jgi:hypothetical protein
MGVHLDCSPRPVEAKNVKPYLKSSFKKQIRNTENLTKLPKAPLKCSFSKPGCFLGNMR